MWVPFFRRDLLSTIALEMAISQSWETPIMEDTYNGTYDASPWDFGLCCYQMVYSQHRFRWWVLPTEAFIPQPRDLHQRNVLRQLWACRKGGLFRGKPSWLGPSTFRNMFFLKPCWEHPKGSAERTKQKDVPMNVKAQNNQSHLGTIRILPGKP